MGLIDSIFGPSEEARSRVSEIQDRYGQLREWARQKGILGQSEKLPFASDTQAALDAFLKEWDTDPDVSKIVAATADLRTLERYAEEQGYGKMGDLRTPYDIERSSTAAEVGASDVAKGVEGAIEGGKEAAKGLADLPWGKIGLYGGGALVAVGLGATLFARR